MPSNKTIKRKLQARSPYREALHELSLLQATLDLLHPCNGDTILFKLGDHSRMTTEMIRVFLDVASQRGLRDLNAFLLKPGDSIESFSPAAFDEISRMKGYVKAGEEVNDDGGLYRNVADEGVPSQTDGEGENSREGQAEGLRAEEAPSDAVVIAAEVEPLELPVY